MIRRRVAELMALGGVVMISSGAVFATGVTDTTIVNVTVSPAISMELSTEKLDFGTHVGYDGMSLMTKDVTATVRTNNAAGYKLTMTTPYTDAGLRTDAGVKIKSLDGDTTRANFAGARWGYSLDAGENFTRVPTSEDEDVIDSYANETEGRDKTVTVGVKLDSTVDPGIYRNKLIFTATTNNLPLFRGITRMQEMTGEICSEAAVGTETSLRDVRDGKYYTVRKLADENCWMVQNLKLGKSGMTYILDSSNTDLPEGEEFRLTEPEENGAVWAASATDATGANGTHYIVTENGNLYNWHTAVAGTAQYGSTGTGDASGTLCPSGWTMASAEGSKSFVNLLRDKYGITTASETKASPLSFTDGGYYTSTSLSQTIFGSYWTKTLMTAERTAQSMVINYGSSNSISYGGSSKVGGLFVRCVAK